MKTQKEKEPLYITKITLENVLAFKHYEFEPGKINVLKGKNGLGKTSTILALQSALGGGSLAHILRDENKPGEIVLILNDGTKIQKKITTAKTSLSVVDPKFGEVGSASLLKKLTGALQANPILFMLKDDEERAKTLLELLPVSLSEEQLKLLKSFKIPAPEEGTDVLSYLAKIRKGKFEERTGVNRDKKTAQANVDQMTLTLPAESEADETLFGSLGELELQLQTLTSEWDKEKESRTVAFDEAKDALLESEKSENKEVQDWYTKELSKLNSERDARFGKIQSTYKAEVEELRAKSNLDFQKAHSEFLEKKTELDQKIGAAREAQQDAAVIAKQREILEQMKAQVDAKTKQSDNLTALLDALDSVSENLVANLPIPGLSVSDGLVYYEENGERKKWNQLNKAKQIELSVKIATIKTGELGIICVDELEHFDPDNRKAFLDYIRTTGLQLIATQVGAGDLEFVNED